MKNSVRLLSALLAALMMAVLFACTKTPSEQKGTDGGTTATGDETHFVADYLPTDTYDGRSFRVGIFDVEGSYDIAAEDATNTVHKAVYDRNNLIEDRYDIDIKEVKVADTYDDAFYAYQDYYLSSEDVYDVCKQIMRNAWMAVVAGMVLPVDQLPYCDTEQEWYLKYVNDALEINDTLFFAYTYEADTVIRALMAVFFNKSILNDMQNAEDLYQLVENGTWTIDKMHEIAMDARNDANGDGEFNIDDDVYGIITENDMYVPSMWMGADLKLVEKDAELGMPYFAASGNEKFLDLLNKAYGYYTTDNLVFDGFTMIGHKTETIAEDVKYFTQNHSLFYMGGIYQWESMTDMEADFGLLPLPKYDEAQENYYSRVCDGHANCVPLVNPDLAFTSVILEALAVESLNINVPAYFEDAIQNRYLRDPEQSLDILKMMQSNTIVDLGDTIWMSFMRNPVVQCFIDERPTFSSTFEKNSSTINTVISGDLEKLALVIEALKSVS